MLVIGKIIELNLSKKQNSSTLMRWCNDVGPDHTYICVKKYNSHQILAMVRRNVMGNHVSLGDNEILINVEHFGKPYSVLKKYKYKFIHSISTVNYLIYPILNDMIKYVFVH